MNNLRLLLGGLLAGAIYNVSGLSLAALVLSEELTTAFELLGAPDAGLGKALLHVATRLFLGLITVWLYVLARDRLGPGPRTATSVGLAVWFLVYVPYLEAIHLLGILSAPTAGVVAVWGLVEVEVAVLAGAWLYRERGAVGERSKRAAV